MTCLSMTLRVSWYWLAAMTRTLRFCLYFFLPFPARSSFLSTFRFSLLALITLSAFIRLQLVFALWTKSSSFAFSSLACFSSESMYIEILCLKWNSAPKFLMSSVRLLEKKPSPVQRHWGRKRLEVTKSSEMHEKRCSKILLPPLIVIKASCKVWGLVLILHLIQFIPTYINKSISMYLLLIFYSIFTLSSQLSLLAFSFASLLYLICCGGSACNKVR